MTKVTTHTKIVQDIKTAKISQENGKFYWEETNKKGAFGPFETLREAWDHLYKTWNKKEQNA